VLKQLLFGKLLTVRQTPTALEGCHCEECSKIVDFFAEKVI